MSVHIFVTKGRDRDPLASSGNSMTESEDGRLDTIQTPSDEISPTNVSSTSSLSGDAEKGIVTILETDMDSYAGIPITWKRPDVPAMIRGVVAEAARHQSVLVMGCGPSALMTQVRNTTAECIQVDGPTVELHCEQFGW